MTNLPIDIFYLHIIFFFIFVVFFYHKYIETKQLQASYRLYALRDELILLVAKDILKEDNPVFKYHYKRVNNLLKMAPHVGFDDLLQVLLKNSHNIEKSLNNEDKELKKVFSDPAMQNKQVREAIEAYYQAVKLMMISHSSLLKVAYLLAKKFNPFSDIIANYFPKGSRFIAALRVTLFADCEMQQLHDETLHIFH